MYLYFYYTIIFYVYNPLDRITTYPSRVSFCEKQTRGTGARFSVPLANHTPLQPPSPHTTSLAARPEPALIEVFWKKIRSYILKISIKICNCDQRVEVLVTGGLKYL